MREHDLPQIWTRPHVEQRARDALDDLGLIVIEAAAVEAVGICRMGVIG